jgi:hypothetical protein
MPVTAHAGQQEATWPTGKGRKLAFLRPSTAMVVSRSGAAGAVITWVQGEKIARRWDRPAAARIREAIRRAETCHRSVRLQRYQGNLSQEPKIKLDVARATAELKPKVGEHLEKP